MMRDNELKYNKDFGEESRVYGINWDKQGLLKASHLDQPQPTLRPLI